MSNALATVILIQGKSSKMHQVLILLIDHSVLILPFAEALIQKDKRPNALQLICIINWLTPEATLIQSFGNVLCFMLNLICVECFELQHLIYVISKSIIEVTWI